jgi:hypothetical protein
LPEEWKELIIVSIYKKDNKTGCSNYRVISFLPTTYKLLSNILVSRLIPYAEEIIGAIIVDFDTTGQLPIIYSAFVKYLRIIGNTKRQCIGSLYPARKLIIQLGGRSCIIFSLSLVSL